MGAPLPRASRGFTLLELMVTAAIMALVMVAVLGAFMTNQKQYMTHSHVAGIQSTLRVASSDIERSLLRAGYGIDPNLAVEVWSGTGAAAVSRDGRGPNGSDELVVQYRDPLFSRRITAASAAQLTLDRAPQVGEELLRGQRLLILCGSPSGQQFAYVTVASQAGTTVNLDAAAEAPFNQQARLGGTPCFSAGTAWATRVERRHYFIQWMNDPVHGGQRPMLMMRRGVDVDADGTADEAPTATSPGDAELVALDVEQLQVAYVMNRPNAAQAAAYGINRLTGGPDSDNNFVYGDVPGVLEVPAIVAPPWPGAGAGPTIKVPCWLNEQAGSEDPVRCTYGGMRRFTGHPGNIRAVRVSLVARSASADVDLAETTPLDPELGLGGRLENLTAAQVGAATRHRRQALTSTISLRNIFQTRHFPPPVEPTLPEANVDGA